ncbi:MAG TPA: response regulator [Chloroflexota bacterium]|nr:response regulator [Chloroflexota bacterium]
MNHPSVLVVDDDSSIRRIVAEILLMEEYEVVTAPNGAEALLAVEHERPALVLLDMRMPVLDGWGFVQGLKERHIEVPILVMTAAQDTARWAAEVGAAGHLAKPFDMSELLSAVERLCRAG